MRFEVGGLVANGRYIGVEYGMHGFEWVYVLCGRTDAWLC